MRLPLVVLFHLIDCECTATFDNQAFDSVNPLPIQMDVESVCIKSCTFNGIGGPNVYAALYVEWNSDNGVGVLDLSDSQFISCFSGIDDSGSFNGAIYVYDGLVTMARVSATLCVASLGDNGFGSFLQLLCDWSFDDAHSISDCTVCQCQAFCSSIFLYLYSIASFHRVNFSETTTSSTGFAIDLTFGASSETVIFNYLMAVNCSGETGLSTSYLEGTLICTNCDFIRNKAIGDQTAALFRGTEGTWDISDCLFEDNSGIFMTGMDFVTITVTNCVFFGSLPEGVSEDSGNSVTSDHLAISFAPCPKFGISESDSTVVNEESVSNSISESLPVLTVSRSATNPLISVEEKDTNSVSEAPSKTEVSESFAGSTEEFGEASPSESLRQTEIATPSETSVLPPTKSNVDLIQTEPPPTITLDVLEVDPTASNSPFDISDVDITPSEVSVETQSEYEPSEPSEPSASTFESELVTGTVEIIDSDMSLSIDESEFEVGHSSGIERVESQSSILTAEAVENQSSILTVETVADGGSSENFGEDEDSGLGTGAIVGIAVGSVVVVGAVGAGIGYAVKADTPGVEDGESGHEANDVEEDKEENQDSHETKEEDAENKEPTEDEMKGEDAAEEKQERGQEGENEGKDTGEQEQEQKAHNSDIDVQLDDS
jgi:hypothetical protein